MLHEHNVENIPKKIERSLKAKVITKKIGYSCGTTRSARAVIVELKSNPKKKPIRERLKKKGRKDKKQAVVKRSPNPSKKW